MTQQKSYGYIDTPVSGVSKLDYPRAVLNFDQDFRLKSNSADEVILTNITSPTDRPETIRVSRREVSNIYNTTSGKNISPNVRAASTTGVELLAQVNSTIAITDDSDADFVQYLPMSAHMVLRVPSSGVDINDINIVIGRLLSSLFDQGAAETANTGLEAKLRGSLVPKGL